VRATLEGAAVPEPDKGLPQVASELWDLTKTYAKQETVDPLKGIGRYVGFGLPGAILLGIGVVLLLLGGLRALQTETDTMFTGNLSWLPYLITLAGGALVAGLAAWRIGAKKGGSR
jgi:hypothetical protein